MGCVQSKSFEYSPTTGVRKFNAGRDYVAGGNRRSSVDRDPSGKVGRTSAVVNDGGIRKAVCIETKMEKSGGDVGNVSRRMMNVPENVGGEELVDGWPKWLVENIHREALAGLVPKGADSYDKLAKVLVNFTLVLFCSCFIVMI